MSGTYIVDDRWRIEPYSDGWRLVERVEGTNPRTGEPTTSDRVYWYGKLAHACNGILDRAGDDVPADTVRSVRDLIEAIDNAAAMVSEAIVSTNRMREDL